jgi:hypothetical protein
MDKTVQTLASGIRNRAQTDTTDATAILLSGYDNQAFSLSITTISTSFWPSPKSFVDLHHAAQLIPIGPDHGSAQFVKHCPSRSVTAKPQCSLQSQGADPVFVSADLPHCAKPPAQGQMRVLKNRACRDRSLISAASTQQQITAHCPAPGSLTDRAPKPLGPAQRQQILAACFFGVEPLFEF